MMRHVCVHNDDVLAGSVFDAVHIGRSKAKLSCAWFQNNVVLAVYFLQLFRNFLGTVRRIIVDNNNLIVNSATLALKSYSR